MGETVRQSEESDRTAVDAAADPNQFATYKEVDALADSQFTRPRSARMSAARAKGRHTRAEWIEMVSFFEACCVRCGSNRLRVERDHIIPVYQGGDDSILNLQPMCARCNAAKGPDRTDCRPAAALRLGKALPAKWGG